jgi:hypothetical protein
VRLGREGGDARFELRRESECQFHSDESTAEGMARLASMSLMTRGTSRNADSGAAIWLRPWGGCRPY